MLDLETIFAPFRSILGNYNYWIASSSPPAQAEIIPATNYLDHTILLEAVRERARILGTSDLKAAASDWQLYYNRAVLPLVLLAMTLGGIGLDASLDKVSLVLEEDKPHSARLHSLETAIFYPSRCPIPTISEKGLLKVNTLEELHQFVFTRVFRLHFSLLFDALYAVTHLSKKILWGNLGISYFSLYNFLGEVWDNPTACHEDSQVVLECPYNLDVAEGKNPLYQPIYYLKLDEPTLPEVVQVRRSCCLYYRLPNYGKCTNCPLLKPDERRAR